jgi:uncharacterized membrane protein YcaP (DUF421 family)
MLFGGWQNLGRTAVIGGLAYVTLVLFLRVSGRRTLSKMNAFDFVVTIAFGSTLATVMLNRNVSLADGAVAFALLVGLQFVVTWSSVRGRWVRALVTGEPVMLLYHGVLLPSALRAARVTESEVRAAIRGAGLASLAQVEAVVLKTDGSFSVVRCDESGGEWSLADVRHRAATGESGPPFAGPGAAAAVGPASR